MDEIGALIGWSGSSSANPMNSGFANADTIQKDSWQSFSSSTTSPCKAVWHLSGGAIHSLEAEYTGTADSTIINSGLVNGFGYKSLLALSVGGSGAIDLSAIGSFMQDEMPKISQMLGFGAPSTAGQPYHDMGMDITAQGGTGSGSGTSPGYSWSWISSSSLTTYAITVHANNPLSSRSADTLESGSVFTMVMDHSSGITTMDYDFALSGGTIKHFQYKQALNSLNLEDVQLLRINGTDYSGSLATVTYVTNEGSPDFVSHLFKGGPLPFAYRPGDSCQRQPGKDGPRHRPVRSGSHQRR